LQATPTGAVAAMDSGDGVGVGSGDGIEISGRESDQLRVGTPRARRSSHADGHLRGWQLANRIIAFRGRGA